MTNSSNDFNNAGNKNIHPADLSENKAVDGQDIHDSPRDEEHLKEEVFTIDLPDVADIPGQEHIHVPKLDGLADVTISSDDEEGVGLFDEDEEPVELMMGNEADVSTVEKNALRAAANDIASEDNSLLRESALDNRDNEGDILNEGSSATNISGKDLDVSGADADDTDEAIGEEDEENNSYSLGADNNDDTPSDNF